MHFGMNKNYLAVQHNKQYFTTPTNSSYWCWKVLLLWTIWTPMWYTFFFFFLLLKHGFNLAQYTLVSYNKNSQISYSPKYTWNKQSYQLDCFLIKVTKAKKKNVWTEMSQPVQICSLLRSFLFFPHDLSAAFRGNRKIFQKIIIIPSRPT